MSRTRMGDLQRLFWQTGCVTAVSMDLRHVTDRNVREAIKELRKALSRTTQALWGAGVEWDERYGNVQWAIARMRHRRGIERTGWWAPRQHVDSFTDEEDVRALLDWIEDTR